VLARLTGRSMNIIGASALTAGAAATTLSLLLGSFALLILGGIVGGFGFGAIFTGTLRRLTPLAAPHERAELFASIFVVAYLAFGVPVIVVGQLVAPLGLEATLVGFAIVILALAGLGILAQAAGRRQPA
jgi:hypothetical protein